MSYPDPNINKSDIADPSRTDQFISDQFYGDLHTKNIPITGERFPFVYDSYGDQSSLQLGTESVKIDGDEFTVKILVDLLFPVGYIYLSLTNEAPDIPYTTWSRVSRGRFLGGVGIDSDTYGKDRQFFAGVNSGHVTDSQGFVTSGDGAYKVQLTTSQIPSHRHDATASDSRFKYFVMWTQFGQGGKQNAGGESNPSYLFPETKFETASPLQDSGDDQPHNNIPPCFGVFVWQRIS